MTRSTLTDLNSDKLRYYSFMVSLDRFDGSCNTLTDLSDRIYIDMCSKQNKRCVYKAFNMITETNESKTLIKHISCDYRFKFSGKRCIRKHKFAWLLIIFNI